MVKSMIGKGPGPSGQQRVGGMGPGGGMCGIAAVKGRSSSSKMGKATGRMATVPEKVASGSSPGGLSKVSNITRGSKY